MVQTAPLTSPTVRQEMTPTGEIPNTREIRICTFCNGWGATVRVKATGTNDIDTRTDPITNNWNPAGS